MTMNPLLSQWDRNGQVAGAQGKEELGRWLREIEGPKKARVEGQGARWQAAAMAIGSVFALVLILLV